MSTSRLLTRLEADIAAATDPVTADCLRAERASYLARQGRFDEAREVLEQLRVRYGSTPAVQVSIRMHLLDGLLSYFTSLGTPARDKLLRAHALSAAAGLTSLRALCAAWMAHIDFCIHRFRPMADSVREALALSASTDTAVKARANLVAAEALHLANRYDLAAPHYHRARVAATADGDDATISALMHNMTTIQVTTWRQVVLSGRGALPATQFALASADSTMNYDTQIGASSLNALVPLIRAQVFSLTGRHRDAVTTYLEVLDTAARQGLQRQFAAVFADRAWCYAELGEIENALSDAHAAEAAFSDQTQVDDKAAAHSRLAQTYSRLGMAIEASAEREKAELAWTSFEAMQVELVRLLVDLPE